MCSNLPLQVTKRGGKNGHGIGWPTQDSPASSCSGELGWCSPPGAATKPQYQVPLNSTLTSTERDKGFMANYGFNTYDESPLQHEMRKENVAKWKISPGQQEAAAHEQLGKTE